MQDVTKKYDAETGGLRIAGISLIASTISSVAGIVAAYPIDTIKIRL